MMSRVRQVVKILGKSGIVFLILLALYFIFSLSGHGVLAAFSFLALIPLVVILIVRGFRWANSQELFVV